MHNAPCIGCTDRTVEPNCHMTCEKYLSFQKETRDICVKRIKHNNLDMFRYDQVSKEKLKKFRNKYK